MTHKGCFPSPHDQSIQNPCLYMYVLIKLTTRYTYYECICTTIWQQICYLQMCDLYYYNMFLHNNTSSEQLAQYLPRLYFRLCFIALDKIFDYRNHGQPLVVKAAICLMLDNYVVFLQLPSYFDVTDIMVLFPSHLNTEF